MADRLTSVFVAALIILASLTALGGAVSQDTPRPLAPQADPAVIGVTTADSKMMFNTSKVDVTFVAKIINNGDVTGTSVKVNITVNETGSTTTLFSDSKTIANLYTGPDTDLTFSAWVKTFSAVKTYVVNVTIVSWSGGNTNAQNDVKVALLTIIDLHDIGPVFCQNLAQSKYLHTSSTENLMVQVQNYGTFDQSTGMTVNLTIWDITTPASPVQLYSDEVSIPGPLDSQMGTMVAYPTAWLTPSTEPVPCRMNITTKAAWDEVASDNTLLIDFSIDNRYDASMLNVRLDTQATYLLPGQNVTINTTLQNMGNMDLSVINVTCTVNFGVSTIYIAYSNFSSLSCVGSGMFLQDISFAPVWHVPDLGGLVNITVQCNNVQDEDATNDCAYRQVLINSDLKDIGIVTTPTYTPIPIVLPGDITFNVTVTNFGNKALTTGYRFNASIYDSKWDIVTYSNTTSAKTIAQAGIVYEKYVWDMHNGTAFVEDGTYHFVVKVILVGDAEASNDEKVLDFGVNYVHDVGIVNATDTVDAGSYTWNTTSPFRDFGVNLYNNGPMTEHVTLNCTLSKAGSATTTNFNSEHTLMAWTAAPVRFLQHQFTEAGDYTLFYEVLFPGDELPANNTLTVNFTLTSLTPPNAVISSPSPGEVPMGGKVYLNAYLSQATSPGATITSYTWTSNRSATPISTSVRDNVSFAFTGMVTINLTVTDSNGLHNTNPAFVQLNVTSAVTEDYQHYDLCMRYSYKSGSAVTPGASNNTTPTVLPPGYLALGGYYDCSLNAAAGGRLYWLNVSVDYDNLDPSAFGLANRSTITLMTYDAAWTLPPGEAGGDAARAWFNLSIGVDQRNFNYHLGLFALPLPAMTAALTGKVTDNLSNPIAGATVKALRSGVEIANATSDANGGYSIDMDIGAYDIKASAPGYEPWSLASVTLGQDGTDLNIVLVAVKKAAVSSLVRDKVTKAVISSADVYLVKSGSGDVLTSTKTGDDGKFALTGLEPGLYLLRVNATGYDTFTTEVFQLQIGQAMAMPDIELTRTNHKPVLSSPAFSPSSGTVANKYSFEITYTDQDNDAPQVNGVYVMVGDKKVILRSEAAGTGAVDYRSGVKFSAKDQSLDEGDFRVVFMASDVRSLGADAISAGNLTVKPDTSADKPTNLLIVAAILVVVIVLLIIGITIFLFRRKAKKDKEEIEKIIAPTETKVSEIMCTGCGSTLPEGTMKCPKCGRDLKKVEDKISKTFKCPTCGGANPEGATKCVVCKKDFTAIVHDTTKMANAPPPPAVVAPEGQQPQAEAESPAANAQPEGDGIRDVSKLSNDEFDDGMNFEGFDEA